MCIFVAVYRDSFDQIEKSMREIGFEWREILQIIAILAAILHIGDIVSLKTATI